jgi:hypothetical protein
MSELKPVSQYTSPIKATIMPIKERARLHETQRLNLAYSPSSPDNARLATHANAPSPRAVPRAVSRSSHDDHRRFEDGSNSSSANSVGDVDDKKLDLGKSVSEKLKFKPPDYKWEYSGDRVGIYDLSSRKERIQRYREKRLHLCFRQVRYSARSNICQKRERVGGRFVKTDRVIRADTEALMHPEAVLRTTQKRQQERFELASVAEAIVRLREKV